eukprot:TRINITY_DN73538_c0_g1_i1.p1 TRINITY_DN73538_c0_g1~~TRINITY_DN73538_c0_g1_i1.p1  ORF type:complete len:112 (+),score=28.55 TRINITY_DN73538_c0_g1_i1:49-336(+)
MFFQCVRNCHLKDDDIVTVKVNVKELSESKERQQQREDLLTFLAQQEDEVAQQELQKKLQVEAEEEMARLRSKALGCWAKEQRRQELAEAAKKGA